MTFVEQAIFTSAVTDRSAGYHVVAQSPGVCEIDARELAVWCPSHDSLLDWGPDAVSFNFHPLPSGAYCISRTTPAGWEYSGRGGQRIYTHSLLVPRDVLARFANNPFSVIRAATAGGLFSVHERVPSQLEPLVLAGSAVPVDQNLLARLAANPGPQPMAHLVQAAREAICLAIAGEPSPAGLMAGLFSCLPPPCRTEFSFTTGLKFSSRRPFRLIALSDDPAEQRWLAHQHNVQLIDVRAGTPRDGIPRDGWAQWVARVLATGRTSFLATQLSKRRFDLKPKDLPALGLQLLEDFEAAQMQTDHGSDGPSSPAEPEAEPARSGGLLPPCELPGAASERRLGHAAHRHFAGAADAAAQAGRRLPGPAAQLDPDSPEVLEKLEHLDDVVYEAIGGRSSALRELETLWPTLLSELGEELVAESRTQYLHYALSVWEDTASTAGVRDPGRAVQALDVLCVLFDEE